MYPQSIVLPVLEPWLTKSTAAELVRFLIDHNLPVSRRDYNQAVPEIREVFDAWLDEQGKTVQDLRGS